MIFHQNCNLIFAAKEIVYTFVPGKSYTTSSCWTPPGPEGSKGRRL